MAGNVSTLAALPWADQAHHSLQCTTPLQRIIYCTILQNKEVTTTKHNILCNWPTTHTTAKHCWLRSSHKHTLRERPGNVLLWNTAKVPIVHMCKALKKRAVDSMYYTSVHCNDLTSERRYGHCAVYYSKARAVLEYLICTAVQHSPLWERGQALLTGSRGSGKRAGQVASTVLLWTNMESVINVSRRRRLFSINILPSLSSSSSIL